MYEYMDISYDTITFDLLKPDNNQELNFTDDLNTFFEKSNIIFICYDSDASNRFFTTLEYVSAFSTIIAKIKSSHYM